MMRNKLPSTMAQSVLAACIIDQKPSSIPMPILVLAIATIMMMKVSIAAGGGDFFPDVHIT